MNYLTHNVIYFYRKEELMNYNTQSFPGTPIYTGSIPVPNQELAPRADIPFEQS